MQLSIKMQKLLLNNAQNVGPRWQSVVHEEDKFASFLIVCLCGAAWLLTLMHLRKNHSRKHNVDVISSTAIITLIYFLHGAVLLQKLIGLQLVKKFPAFHGTRRFITALISVRHLSLSWASPIQSINPHPTSWISILILSIHLCLGLPSGLIPSGFPTKTLYTPSPHLHAIIILRYQNWTIRNSSIKKTHAHTKEYYCNVNKKSNRCNSMQIFIHCKTAVNKYLHTVASVAFFIHIELWCMEPRA